MEEHLFLTIAVLVALLLAHTDLKATDDGTLSDVTGQADISISGTFQGSVGVVAYIGTDTNDGPLRSEDISPSALIIDDIKPLIIDVVTTDTGSRSTQQLTTGLSAITGDVATGAIKVGNTSTASIGSLTVSGLDMAGSTIKVWDHRSRNRVETRRPRRGIGGVLLRKKYDEAMFEILSGSLTGSFGFAQTVDTEPQPRGTADLSQPLIPNGSYHELVQLEPISQLQFRNIIRQAYGYSCGSAALITLLDYYLGRNPEEHQVIGGLLRYGETDEIMQCRSFSLLDVKRYAVALGYRGDDFRAEFSDLDVLEHPASAPIHYAGFEYFVVVRDVCNGHVFVTDPTLDSISLTRTRFEKIQDQDILFVIFPSRQGSRNALALSDRDMHLVDDRTVSLLASREFPQINKIIENQVRELGIGSSVVHLCTEQQVPRNKNNLWR